MAGISGDDTRPISQALADSAAKYFLLQLNSHRALIQTVTRIVHSKIKFWESPNRQINQSWLRAASVALCGLPSLGNSHRQPHSAEPSSQLHSTPARVSLLVRNLLLAVPYSTPEALKQLTLLGLKKPFMVNALHENWAAAQSNSPSEREDWPREKLLVSQTQDLPEAAACGYSVQCRSSDSDDRSTSRTTPSRSSATDHKDTDKGSIYVITV